VSRNWVYVAASTTDGTAWHGDRYAKCIPAGMSGDKGRTLVYHVKPGQDVLEAEYDWYATGIYLAGTDKGTSVVRMGPWSEGHEPSKDDLALAFYFGGKPLKTYSTLDIAGSRENVRSSVSHYTWYKRVMGYCWIRSDQSKFLRFGFALETTDGRVVCFDARTGERMDGWEPEKLRSADGSGPNALPSETALAAWPARNAATLLALAAAALLAGTLKQVEHRRRIQRCR
jgi:hypothetical protein